jgi:uncharacterized protein (TIGR04141 family)
MPSSEDKKYKLSIYLIKESYTDDTQIVPKCGEMNSYEIPDEVGRLGTLYIKTNYVSVPKWADFFCDIFLPEDIGLATKSARAVFIVAINNKKLCLTFGHAHFLIEPLAIVRNFGMKVALNVGGETSLRAVDKTCLDVVEIKSKEQSSKEVGIETFDFDFETDILKSITAKNEDGSSTLSGRDSVSIGAAVKLDTLREFLSDILTKYESDAYKEKFSWVDNVAEERDKSVIARLIQLLIEKIMVLDPRVWLAIPEVIIWEEISGFAYKKRRNPVVRQDIHLERWINEVVNDDDIDINYLKRKKVFLYDVNHDLYKHWPVYHCLNAEIDLDGQKYILNDGSWYLLNTDFVDDVNGFYDAIEVSSIELPPYGTKKEPEYNNYVATTYPNKFDLMDRKTIHVGGGRSSVEFCDLYTTDKQMIHVKKYGGSSVLSHLFQQGVVSGELFISNNSFWNEVNSRLSDDFKLEDVERKPNPAEYEICYAIMSAVPGDLHIPFFSKVVMKNAVKRLQVYGYKVTKKKIPIS